MGMTSDQNELVSFEEQEAAKKREEAEKAKAKEKSFYTLLSVIYLNGEKVQLLVGEDKRFYKSVYLRSVQYDKKNNTPFIDIFSDEIIPLTKEEFDSYFSKK